MSELGSAVGLGGSHRQLAVSDTTGGSPRGSPESARGERGNCGECGASLASEGPGCDDAFHTLLAWEIDRPELGLVHHLFVLCFHLQHPSRYSPEALAWGRDALVDFLERGVTPRDVRRRDQQRFSSANRTWRVRGTPELHGAYEREMRWTMRAQDVVAGGIDHYVENVRTWARSILATLREI